MKIAGIDIGTTGCKCTVYSEDGNLIAEVYREYSATITEQAHTINPDVVWENVCEMLKEITKSVVEIGAICITSFGEANVFLDENNNSLIDSFLYTDPRGEKESNELVKDLGEEYIYKNTGLTPAKMYSSVKWKWLQNNKPEILDKCSHICLYQDYIVYMLSGVLQVDYSLASRTMAFDVHNLKWDKRILDLVGVKEEQLPKVVEMGTKAGEMKEELRKKFGFENRPMIVSGCHDQMAAAIGTGVLNRKMAVDGTGTVECITSIFSSEDKVNDDLLNKGGYAVVPYMKDLYATYAFSYTGGALLKWYRDKLAKHEADMFAKQGKNVYEEFNKDINDDKPSGLLILPYFAGAGTPYLDDNAKGVIVGLTMDTTKSQIYQGLMEGVTYEMKLSLDYLKKAGIDVDRIYATGGGANSKKWLQMKADILDKEIVSLGAAQSGTLGCVMLAGVACGEFEDLNKAADVFVKYNEVYKPRKDKQELYNKLYKEYIKIYPALRSGGKEN